MPKPLPLESVESDSETSKNTSRNTRINSLSVTQCLEKLDQLLNKIVPVPAEWISEDTIESLKNRSIVPVYCNSWSKLIASWHKALHWTTGLDTTLSVMMACIASTKVIGDPVWIKVLGPPSSGKTTLCEALSIAKKYIYPKDTVTGLTSGYQTDRDGSENLSLVLKIKDKTFIIKDGDTLLRLRNREQVLSQFRALYDKALRTQYNNKMTADHEGINTTVILCGTSTLYELDSAESGDRFLVCNIVEDMTDDLKRKILLGVFTREVKNSCCESNGLAETHYDPYQVAAMQQTGGYVEYLRENASKLLPEVEIPDNLANDICDMGEFIGFLRARPSKGQTETAECEFGARAVSQLVKLARCLAIVLNKKTVDKEVVRRIHKVTLDTAKGSTLKIVDIIYKRGQDGIELNYLSHYTGHKPARDQELVIFLGQIGALEYERRYKRSELEEKVYWRLTPKMRKLYESVTMNSK